MFGEIWFVVPMMITTLLDFYLAPTIGDRSRPHRQKAALLVSLCGNLGLLIYFKYSHFLLYDVIHFIPIFNSERLAHQMTFLFNVILPAGISFYTFQTLAYVIDVYRGESAPETNLWKFISFVTFFPHLVAGPLTRHNQLLPGLERIKQEGISPQWRAGIYLFIIGLSKKLIIADRIADVIDPWLVDAHTLGFIKAWLALFGYAFQIYFDFSGYSDMAIGLGRLFGIELPQNFASPYQAVDPSDFWRRWHITLSSWLRDYLYISLGGNRRFRLRNLLITMLLGGLWHGAKWTFVVWGFYHGMLLILYHVLKHKWDAWPTVLRRMLTFFLVTLGWVFFRSDSFSFALQWFTHLGGLSHFDLTLSPTIWKLIIFQIAISVMVWKASPASAFQGFSAMTRLQQVGLGLLFTMDLFLINKSSQFLYFRF